MLFIGFLEGKQRLRCVVVVEEDSKEHIKGGDDNDASGGFLFLSCD